MAASRYKIASRVESVRISQGPKLTIYGMPKVLTDIVLTVEAFVYTMTWYCYYCVGSLSERTECSARSHARLLSMVMDLLLHRRHLA